MMQKNVGSQKWIVFAFDETDNTPKAGDANQITAEISKDGAAGGGNITDTNPTELEDGYYAFDVTQGETDADLLLILPESSTPNIQVIGVPGSVYTTEPNRNKLSVDSNGRMDVIKVAGTTQSANDNSADINLILLDTGELQVDDIPGKIATLDTVVDGVETKVDTAIVDIAAVKAETVLIVADTGELQVDDIPGKIATLDTVVDGVETKVDTAISDIATAQTDLDAITDTGVNVVSVSADAIDAASLNADAITKIWAKAMSDLAGIPAANASVLDALNIAFMALRNKQTASATEQTISNDAGAVIATADLSDAAGTTTKEGYA